MFSNVFLCGLTCGGVERNGAGGGGGGGGVLGNKEMKEGLLRNGNKATVESKTLHREEPDIYRASANTSFFLLLFRNIRFFSSS